MSIYLVSYRVGSANFSQRKIGHAHDNSANSENVAGAPPTECARAFHLLFRKRSGKSELFFYPRPKYSWNESTTSSVDGRLTRYGQGLSARPQAALRKVLFSTAKSKKRKKQANVVNRRKLLLKGYNFKERKHDRFGKRPAANAAEKIDERSTEADVSAFRRPIGLVFFFSTIV